VAVASSGATPDQVVWSSWRGSRNIEHIGSAHDDGELEALRAAARQRLAAGQGELDLGLSRHPQRSHHARPDAARTETGIHLGQGVLNPC